MDSKISSSFQKGLAVVWKDGKPELSVTGRVALMHQVTIWWSVWEKVCFCLGDSLVYSDVRVMGGVMCSVCSHCRVSVQACI
jgi:hypothetical protein